MNKFVENNDCFEVIKNDFIRLQNEVRKNPMMLLPYLLKRKQEFDGKLWREPGEIPVRTNEGVSAVIETIEYFEKTWKNGSNLIT